MKILQWPQATRKYVSFSLIFVILLPSCAKDDKFGPAPDHHLEFEVNNTKVGDTTTHNGNILTWNGSYWEGDDNSTWVWDQSQETFIEINIDYFVDQSQEWYIEGDYLVVNGDYQELNVGDIFFIEETNTIYEVSDINDGNVIFQIVGDNSNAYWNWSEQHNEVVLTINYDNSTTMNYHGGYVEINGSEVYYGDVIFDYSTQKYYKLINTNYGVWVNDDGLYQYNNTTNTWHITTVNNQCCATCPPGDTTVVVEYQIDTINTTTTDTFYIQDTVVVIEQADCSSLALTTFEVSWLMKITCFDGVSYLSGGEELINSAMRWSPNAPLFGTHDLAYDPLNDEYIGHSICRTVGQEMDYLLAANSSGVGSLPLTSQMSDCDGGLGPITGKKYPLEVIGPVPPAWAFAPDVQVVFSGNLDESQNPAYYIVLTQELYDWMVSMGLTPVTYGYLTVRDYDDNGNPNRLTNYGNDQSQDLVVDYIHPVP